MASRVHDLVFLLGALIAMVAFGLLIVVTRPAVPARTEVSPSPPAVASSSAIPSIVVATQAPATSAPVPTTAAPVPTTAPPTASPAPRTATPQPLPSASR